MNVFEFDAARFPVAGWLVIAAFVCGLAGLFLGVFAIFHIGTSRGRLRGYGHAIMAIIASSAMLLGILVLMFAVGVPSRHRTRLARPSATEMGRSLGRGKTAADHGPNCQSIRAAKIQGADLYKSEVLAPIAERGDLTTHEQMHLVDVAIDDISADLYRKEVLIRLARNPALTAEGRAYMMENLKGMSTDLYRKEVLGALRETSPPRSR